MKRPKDILSQPYHIQEYINHLESKLIMNKEESKKDLLIKDCDIVISGNGIRISHYEYKNIRKSLYELSTKYHIVMTGFNIEAEDY